MSASLLGGRISSTGCGAGGSREAFYRLNEFFCTFRYASQSTPLEPSMVREEVLDAVVRYFTG